MKIRDKGQFWCGMLMYGGGIGGIGTVTAAEEVNLAILACLIFIMMGSALMLESIEN